MITTDSAKELEKIFLSYNSILKRFKLLNIKTKSNKEITHKDLRRAVDFMMEKHPTCKWKQKKINGKRYYILIEGYYWLILVYFNKEMTFVDADIDFFSTRIRQYEKILSIVPKKFWNEDIPRKDLTTYFNRKYDTIRKAVIKMNIATNGKYKYFKNNQIIISKFGIEWLCKNYFKQKYLELLEEYKTELTKEYINRGFPYNIF